MRYTTPPNQQAYYELVWDLVRQIPPGRVMAYGHISMMLPPPNGVEIEVLQSFRSALGGRRNGKLSR